MSDPVLDQFNDLRERGRDYPGKRKPVLRSIRRPKAPEPPGWDADPVYYVQDGEKREYFTIRHLAAALDYSQQSIRAWENSGLLPKSGYRSPKPRKPTIGGRNTKGKRLWTREQIEGLLKIAEEEGVIVNKQPPTKAFARRVAAFYKTLR
jgi:hypothetical protein